MNSYQAKKIPLTEILARLGHEPVRKDKGGIEWVYQSPFRKEKIPSLFVNVKANIWNDFGDGGGNVLDFVMRHERYHNISDALQFLDRMFSNHKFKPSQSQVKISKSLPTTKEPTLILDKVRPLEANSLIDYLTQERAINLFIGRAYLKEIHFHNIDNNKKYFALGMENMSGGYEIRNPFFKSSLGKKDITIINGQNREEVSVFEGYLDFLSYLTDQNKKELSGDVLILNSIVFTKKVKTLILAQGYSKIYTFLDNDRKGEETLTSFKELPITVIPCNHLYDGHKDYNLFLQHKSK